MPLSNMKGQTMATRIEPSVSSFANSSRPFHHHELISAWISKYTPSKLRDESTFQFLSLKVDK